VKAARAAFGEAAGDIPVDLAELTRQAESAMRPHGPPEPSMPLPYREVQRQHAQAAQAARPETARPPPLPEPELQPEPFPATFPVTDVSAEPVANSPFPDTLRPVAMRTADTVRPPRPRMPHAASRAAKRLPLPPPKKP
jgi:hypothetical protein